MFQNRPSKPSMLRSTFEMLELVFHVAVQSKRKTHSNAIVGLLLSIFQSLMMVIVFFVMMHLFGLRKIAIRGDFMLYVMSGVFMFMTHVKTLGAISACDNSTSPMMMHSKMNTLVSILAAALSSLYQQTIAAAVILLFYHTLFTPISIDDPVGMLGLHLLSWFSGIGVGMLFMAARPWQPDLVRILTMLYQRVNMIASGKMITANAAGASTRALFDWNPLFHTIDQGRGYIFLNYTPHFTTIGYPIKVACICIILGLMAEFYTRQHASASWNKG